MNDRKDNCKKRHFRLHLTDQLLSIKFKIFDPNRLNLIFISIFESVVCTDGKSSSLARLLVATSFPSGDHRTLNRDTVRKTLNYYLKSSNKNLDQNCVMLTQTLLNCRQISVSMLNTGKM